MTGLSPTWTSVLGWTLVHFLWQGTALAIALAMALTVVPRRFARVRYALGCSTLALMLAVPTATAWRLSDPQQPASPLFEAARATSCRVRYRRRPRHRRNTCARPRPRRSVRAVG